MIGFSSLPDGCYTFICFVMLKVKIIPYEKYCSTVQAKLIAVVISAFCYSLIFNQVNDSRTFWVAKVIISPKSKSYCLDLKCIFGCLWLGKHK